LVEATDIDAAGITGLMRTATKADLPRAAGPANAPFLRSATIES
jgi:hypothetical protein